jgi:putative endonuclease
MHESSRKIFYVYIMASGPRGVLYTGMTSDLPRRAWEHRDRLREGSTRRYWVDRLVYFEHHDDAAVAARRERSVKRWPRAWKIALTREATRPGATSSPRPWQTEGTTGRHHDNVPVP